MQPSHPTEQNPDFEGGSDYVALIIEWDNDQDITFVSAVDTEPERTSLAPMLRTMASIVGVLGVLALATWGLHRLTA